MSGRATLATARLRLATAATVISAASTSFACGGEDELGAAAGPVAVAVASMASSTASPRLRIGWRYDQVGGTRGPLGGAVPDGPRPGGDERRDQPAGRRLRHHGDDDPGGDRPLRAGHGGAD